MRILVLGSTGFIGRHVAAALEAAGHAVVRGTRERHDFTRLATAEAWVPLLEGCDGVVNAVGIFREEGTQTFEALHDKGPAALFDACARLAIPVVQVSALGAAADAPAAFLRSKAAADGKLVASGAQGLVLQPSLVFGRDGTSAAAFRALASLPVVPVPADAGPVQPVHVDDVAAAVVRWFAHRAPARRVPAVGPRALALADYLRELRGAMRMGRARVWHVPSGLVRLAAAFSAGLVDRDALRMLAAGNTGDAAAFRGLLGREPRDPAQFVAVDEVRAVAAEAKLAWLLPLLRIAIAIVWITAGVVSAGLYPEAESRAMLARVGITGVMATLALHGAALLDLALGIATLALRARRWLWVAQMALIVAYTAIITAFLPEQWLHPFGPVVKNVPLLAAILLLHQLEPR